MRIGVSLDRLSLDEVCIKVRDKKTLDEIYFHLHLYGEKSKMVEFPHIYDHVTLQRSKTTRSWIISHRPSSKIYLTKEDFYEVLRINNSLTDASLARNGFGFTQHYMQTAYTNGKIDLLVWSGGTVYTDCSVLKHHTGKETPENPVVVLKKSIRSMPELLECLTLIKE